MQNTQQQISAEFVIDIIWQHINIVRGNMQFNDLTMPILFVLYAVHKGYSINTASGYLEPKDYDDELYHDLINVAYIDENSQRIISSLYEALNYIDNNKFNAVYADVLKSLADRLCSYYGRMRGEFYTPQEISQLMAYIIKEERCRSIYDPFCGTASIVHELSTGVTNIYFDGQEKDAKTALFARVNLEAANVSNGKICLGDSIRCWNHMQYDAIATCPPFNLRLSLDEQRELENRSQPYYLSRSIEEMVHTTPFYINNAKLSVVLEPTGICFRGAPGSRNYNLRRYLVEENLLDTIIALPANILYGTSIPSVILICKRHRRENDPITFIHAEEYYTGDRRKRILDVDRLVEMIQTDRKDCVAVKKSDIIEYAYNLNPSLYINQNLNLKEGQQVVRLGDLVVPIEGERINDNTVIDSISPRILSRDFLEILLNNSKVTNSESRRNISYRRYAASDKKYILSYTSMLESKYGLFTDNKDFACPADIKVYEVNETAVIPAYLAHILVNNEAFTKNSMPLSHYMSFPIVIDSLDKQKELVNKIVQEYRAQTIAEQEADAMRLGVKNNISDLEHMLGSTQFRIGKIIQRLEYVTPEATNYQRMVKQLKDNVEYMNRIIHYSSANIASETINKKTDDIGEFLNTYADGWNNYGCNSFKLTIINEMGETPQVSFDKVLMTVMLDSILNNASGHGFGKIKREGNSVQISLSIVEHESCPYLLMSVANNGSAMIDGFTISDYISRGRYSASSGHSGLGGYHIYQIVKGHQGFIYLDSNKLWSVIVDVLLPINYTNINNIPVYDHECI